MGKPAHSPFDKAREFEIAAEEAAESAREAEREGRRKLAMGLWDLARKWRVKAIKLRALADL